MRPDDYIDHYSELVQLERKEEMERYEREIREMSGGEREDSGRALLHLRGREAGEELGGTLVKFMRNRRGEPLPDTEISVGDLVMLSKKSPMRDDNPTGTVAEKTNYSVTVVFDGQPHPFVYGEGLRMDLYVNDVTYQRMLDALGKLKRASGRLADLREVIVGRREPITLGPVEIPEWNNKHLDDSQREAVENAISADDFYLVHGPPGTGKTTTIIEIIEQAVDAGESVLATAASNAAVDNMVEFLVSGGVDVVRVGHPARVTPTLRDHTLDSMVGSHPKYQRGERMREQAFDLKARQDELTRPSGRYRRGMSDEKIKQLAEEGRGSRGVDVEKIREMADWIDLNEKVDRYFGEADRLRDEAVDEVIEEADVVCATNSTSGSRLLEDVDFDLLVIDEATQATEPSCLIPITHAGRVVMAGDHRQLPPTVISQRAAESGLMISLFERLAESESGDDIRSMLGVQYRMHEDIMNFSSEQFYEGRVEADGLVKRHTLGDLEVDFERLRLANVDFGDFSVDDIGPQVETALDPTEPLVFMNTEAVDAPERSRPGSSSKENRGEADLVCGLVSSCLIAGVDEDDIAVVAPYHDQVELIRDKISEWGDDVDTDRLEVHTVDGFQGREKEVVLISLTRSNPDGVVGFLNDIRRFNVALTRARRKAIVIGDAATVASVPLYRDFVEYVRNAGVEVTLR